MDYEKKYKEALEIAQKLYQDCPNGKNDRLYHTTDLEKIFPELRESEDEKIRKELIEHIKDQQSSFISAPDCRDKYEEEENNKYNSWLAWLERQGEQNLVVTRKFRIGDIITPKGKKEYYTIIDIVDGWYEFREKHVNGGIPIHYQFGWELVEQKSAWSEEDEKEYKYVLRFVNNILNNCGNKKDYEHSKRCYDWLKSIKQRIGG